MLNMNIRLLYAAAETVESLKRSSACWGRLSRLAARVRLQLLALFCVGRLADWHQARVHRLDCNCDAFQVREKSAANRESITTYWSRA